MFFGGGSQANSSFSCPSANTQTWNMQCNVGHDPNMFVIMPAHTNYELPENPEKKTYPSLLRLTNGLLSFIFIFNYSFGVLKQTVGNRRTCKRLSEAAVCNRP